MSLGNIITVFGSARPQAGEADYEEARRLGGELARRGFQVCTGGYTGVMEAVSRGAKEAGGRTIAITSTFFADASEHLGGRGARREHLAGAAVRADPLWRGLRGLQGRHGHAGGVGGGLGDAEQGRDGGETVCDAGRFLGADHRARAGSGGRTTDRAGEKRGRGWCAARKIPPRPRSIWPRRWPKR